MKITCLQKNLKRGINIIQNIVGKNLTLPILNNILLVVEKNKLKFTSTDLEVGITHWIPGKVVKEGEITIPAKLLTNLANSLPSEKIEISLKDDFLNINGDNFKSTIKGMPAKEFPIIPKIKGDLLVKIEALNLKQALSQVVGFTSFSDIRPEISGVLINFKGKELKFVSTDSFRLGEKTISQKDNKSDLKKSIILPLKTTQELIRILSELDQDELVEVLIEKNQILFKTPNTHLMSRLIEGEYPNYEQLIAKQFETNIVISKEEFLNVVKISSFFSGKINDIKIKVVPKKSSIQISAQNIEVGENVADLKCEAGGKEVEIIFNYKYLLDGLNSIASSKVMMGFNGESGPAILKPANDSSYTYIIMPIKL